MRSIGIRSKVAKKFKVTTDSSHKKPIAQNYIDQVFEADFINDAWTSDLTYVWTGSGWLYLTVIMDLYNREIIGHSFSSRMTAETTVNPALDMAVMHRRPSRGVIMHSDRGSQYASKTFRNTSIIAFFSVNKNSGVSINELEGEIDCVLVVSYPV